MMKSELIIKRISQWDEQIIAEMEELELDAFQDGAVNRWVLVPFVEKGIVIGAFLQGKLVGMIEIFRCADKIHSGYIFSMVVKKGYRNQKIGTELLKESRHILEKLEINSLILTVAPENEIALTLYNKIGFQKKDFYENHYGKGEHRLELEWVFN